MHSLVYPLVFCVCAILPSLAHAQREGSHPDDPRCALARATARSRAALLIAPSLWAEAVHVPQVGDQTAIGLFGGESGWQLRASVGVDPLAMVRGVMTLEATDAECRELAALAEVMRALEVGDGMGELDARRAARASLVSQAPRATALLARAEARLAMGLATQPEVAAIRSETTRIARRVAQLDAEIAQLVAAGHEGLEVDDVRRSVDAHDQAALELERRRSAMRRLDAWSVQLRAGIVPAEEPDWFGQLSLGVSLGAIAHAAAEDAVVRARERTLADDAAALGARFRAVERRLAATVPALREELAHVEARLDVLERERALFASIETSEVEHLRAMNELERMALEADRAGLAAQIEARAPLARGEEPGARR